MAYLEGRLRRVPDRPENEHTGYVLEVEVELSSVVNVEGILEGQVAITGDVEIVDYPQRGKVLLFRTTSAAAIEEEEEAEG